MCLCTQQRMGVHMSTFELSVATIENCFQVSDYRQTVETDKHRRWVTQQAMYACLHRHLHLAFDCLAGSSLMHSGVPINVSVEFVRTCGCVRARLRVRVCVCVCMCTCTLARTPLGVCVCEHRRRRCIHPVICSRTHTETAHAHANAQYIPLSVCAWLHKL